MNVQSLFLRSEAGEASQFHDGPDARRNHGRKASGVVTPRKMLRMPRPAPVKHSVHTAHGHGARPAQAQWHGARTVEGQQDWVARKEALLGFDWQVGCQS